MASFRRNSNSFRRCYPTDLVYGVFQLFRKSLLATGHVKLREIQRDEIGPVD